MMNILRKRNNECTKIIEKTGTLVEKFGFREKVENL